jgi:hypothetical protein
MKTKENLTINIMIIESPIIFKGCKWEEKYKNLQTEEQKKRNSELIKEITEENDPQPQKLEPINPKKQAKNKERLNYLTKVTEEFKEKTMKEKNNEIGLSEKILSFFNTLDKDIKENKEWKYVASDDWKNAMSYVENYIFIKLYPKYLFYMK